MSDTQLQELLNNFENANILVIGDIMLDRFVYGHVDRISPESPVPVLAINREDYMLGGAGNTLANISGLQAHADIIALIGDDEDGEKIKAKINELGIDASHLVIDKQRPTTVKTRFLAGHQQLLRTDFEKKHGLSSLQEEEILNHAVKLLPKVTTLILSDYGKGLLSRDLIQKLIAHANERGVKTIVDPKGTDYSLYKGAYAITPNKKELHEGSAMPVSNDDEIKAAAKHLINTCALQAIIATRSAEGISVIQKNGDISHFPGADIEVFDVSGAGDSVIASIAASLSAGGSLEQAAAIANLAGSIVVTKVGTAPIRLEEIKEALQHTGTEYLTASGKERSQSERSRRGDVLNWQEAAEQVRKWKAKGLKVGFTNGCFDIVHFGHVTYLNDARDHCDRLIMGLNKDSSIRVLKGPERPVHNEQSRAAVIAALGSIDTVVLFGADKEGDDNTACALLDTIKPDIYFKGGDYTVDEIPEAPTVLKNGGEVKVMPVYDGHSTTNSIAKIKAGE